jgi:hypothetical protein
MELKTEIRDGWLYADGYCVRPAVVSFHESMSLEHDALAAHALMQAMADCPSLSLECKAITDRADELMREWTK